MPAAPRTIGQVLESIRGEFPDISVSKVRYLENEGLISPERDHPSGYRRFYPADVERLLFVLRAQRDRYLPLKVIREELAAMDRGEVPPETADATVPTTPQNAEPSRRQPRQPGTQRQLFTRRELLSESGLGEAALIELERLKVISHRKGTQRYGREMLALAVAAKRLGDYGVEPRQMRVLQQSASLEAALVEQAISQYQGRQGVPKEVLREVYRLVLHAHSGLMFSQLFG
ncbi:transcriptional regulator FtsR [Arachnia propionica]|jgi:transcriptional regulator, merR family|uniref:MerR family regulatory protein n=1 Tax=Arachnia propionica TaxID=1750 RepID=A0A3N4D7P4_9ACTN|nr:MerR family transcriptional regulator [Arachnia propionica]AFN45623.1 transcriptional regulator, MerR family [Arachnia propionica F0230a]QCT37846.1 MerR family transcriptional regulator [Arachnia propionica]QUC09799.1 MerR family transcriptional regulator [Arachnia propionica]RPA16725.1 MerR family transcriptional regulator [Arachnia propionica]VEH70215.1 MerR family regulatory protein [Arachnia propionica]